MTDASIRTKQTLHQDDQRWLGNGGEPIGTPRSIVLDRSAFDLVTNFPNGFIPSGVFVAKLAATGLYVPYAGAPSEVQLVTPASSGNTSATLDGEAITAAAFTADAAGATAFQAALEALSNVSPGDVTVAIGSGATAGKFVVTFAGRWTGLNVPQLVVTGTGAAISTTTAGGPASADGSGVARGALFSAVPYDRDSTGDLSAALFWSGEVIESHLPTHHGLDAAARAALTHISFVS